jgi:hypothetical protein
MTGVMDFRLGKFMDEEYHHLVVNGVAVDHSMVDIHETELPEEFLNTSPELDTGDLMELSSQGLDQALSTQEIVAMAEKMDGWATGVKTLGPWNWKCTTREPMERQLVVGKSNFESFKSACEDDSISTIFITMRMTNLQQCITFDGEVHMAVLMIDKNAEDSWFLDPNGLAAERFNARGQSWFEQEQLMDVLTLIIGKYVIYPPCDYKYGPQSFESQLSDNTTTELGHGYCASWALFMIFMSFNETYETPAELFRDKTAEENRDLVHGWTVWVRRQLGIIPLNPALVRTRKITTKSIDALPLIGFGSLVGIILLLNF